MPLQSLISSLRRRSHRAAPPPAHLQANTEKIQWRLVEVFTRMWDLGFTAFGGPPVHFQILHRRFVEGMGFQGGSKWLDEQTVSMRMHMRSSKLNGRSTNELGFKEELGNLLETG